MDIKTVMVIDDCDADQLLTSITIEEFDESINIIQAYDGEEALQILKNKQNNKPDVIILDINMPRMNGLEFLEVYCKEESPAAVVAMLTSSEQKKDKEIALSYDCVHHYFVKVFNDIDMHKIASI